MQPCNSPSLLVLIWVKIQAFNLSLGAGLCNLGPGQIGVPYTNASSDLSTKLIRSKTDLLSSLEKYLYLLETQNYNKKSIPVLVNTLLHRFSWLLIFIPVQLCNFVRDLSMSITIKVPGFVIRYISFFSIHTLFQKILTSCKKIWLWKSFLLRLYSKSSRPILCGKVFSKALTLFHLSDLLLETSNKLLNTNRQYKNWEAFYSVNPVSSPRIFQLMVMFSHNINSDLQNYLSDMENFWDSY